MSRTDMNWVMRCSLIVGGICLPTMALAARNVPEPTTSPSPTSHPDLVQLNFPENIEIGVLVDYVSKRLDLNILYDASIATKKVTISSPSGIPKDSLLGLLQSVLRMSGFAIIDADQPGWKRIVLAEDMVPLTDIRAKPEDLPQAGSIAITTQVFKLEYVQTATAEKTIRPFLSKPGGNVFVIPEGNLLLVTDYGPNLKRVASLIAMLDKAGPSVKVQFLAAKHLEAAELAKKVNALLEEQNKFAGDRPDPRERIAVTAEPRTNQIVLVSAEGSDGRALELIQRLDVAAADEAETRTYRFQRVSPQRIDTLAKQRSEGERGKELYKSVVDAESGMLIVTAPKSVHAFIDDLKIWLDTPPVETETRTYRFQRVSPQRIDTLARQRSEGEGGKDLYKAVVDAESGMLIVTAPKSVHEFIDDLKTRLDIPPAETETRTYRFQHVSPQRIDTLARQRSEGDRGKEFYKSIIDAESGMLVVTASKSVHEIIDDLKTRLDIPPADTETRTHRFQNVPAARIDKLARGLSAEKGPQDRYYSVLDAESGVLVVTAPISIHDLIEDLKRQLDVPVAESESHMRFYKLMNSTASEVLATIRSLDSGGKGLPVTAGLLEGQETDSALRKETFTGPNEPPSLPNMELPKPPAYQPSTTPVGAVGPIDAMVPRMTAEARDAIVTADANTNTIIVVAPPAAQNFYQKLIRMLDKRRPQVLVEAILVTIDTSGGFSLGVELSKADLNGKDNDYLVFSSFGLGDINVKTGQLAITPGVGFNGTLIAPEGVSVIVKALANSGRSRVLSAPKVLVNDNATATLTSVTEAPFTSVNASDTVATTSFAGYAQAGTTVTVTPHISEGDHLMLKYSISLNSFTGEGAAGIPPPRQTNSVTSEVTIPDGYTVVVGGLKRRDTSHTRAKIPWLGDVPWLRYLVSSQNDSDSESTLFVFLRPLVLRDDEFEDLKYLSSRDLELADQPGNFPASPPLVMQ